MTLNHLVQVRILVRQLREFPANGHKTGRMTPRRCVLMPTLMPTRQTRFAFLTAWYAVRVVFEGVSAPLVRRGVRVPFRTVLPLGTSTLDPGDGLFAALEVVVGLALAFG